MLGKYIQTTVYHFVPVLSKQVSPNEVKIDFEDALRSTFKNTLVVEDEEILRYFTSEISHEKT